MKILGKPFVHTLQNQEGKLCVTLSRLPRSVYPMDGSTDVVKVDDEVFWYNGVILMGMMKMFSPEWIFYSLPASECRW